MVRPFFDAHCDALLRAADEGVDLLRRSERGHLDVPRLIEAGVGCQVFACFVGREEPGAAAVTRTLALLDHARALAASDSVVFPESAAELDALGEQRDRLGVLLAVEGGRALGGDPAMVAELKRRGVRYLTLAWGDNDLGGSAFGDGRRLSALGREVVSELAQERVLVDLSHASDATFDDVLELTDAPPVVSHGGARALCSSPRNMTDEQVRRVAERGGVVGVYFVASFISEQLRRHETPVFERYLELAARDKEGAERFRASADAELAQLPDPPLEQLVDHIVHLIEIGGVDAVGLGSDFDGYKRGIEGMRDCRDLPRLAAALRRRGLSADELDKLCWDNWTRVFRWTFG